MKNEEHDLFTKEDRIKMLKDTKGILNGFIVMALLLSFGFLISEVIENTLNQAKVIAYSCSILLTVIMFLLASKIDKKVD